MSRKPLVSICCLTYCHKPYISQCIEGFLMQETSFEYEIIIHDDASNDGTREILEEYASKYPTLFKLILQDENQYSKGIDVMAILFSYATGKYIAMCEGDDYWTDPLKLQKQVDFLEKNHEYVLCSHNYDNYNEETQLMAVNKSMNGDYAYNIDNLAEGLWLCHPLTVVFRISAFNSNEYSKYKYSIDAVLFFYLLKQGKGYYIDRNMAVYRSHHGGIWSMQSLNKQRETEFLVRFAIYDVEKSDKAALYLKSLFFKPMNRIWMLKNYKLIYQAYVIIAKHFGGGKALKIISGKFLGII